MSETRDVLPAIMRELGRGASRVFRVNTGLAWVGTIVKRTAAAITLANYRPLHAGLVKGGSDIIGWNTIRITPEMVGLRVAVFTAVEAKSGDGQLRDEQATFLNVVREAGGIAVMARSAADARAALDTFRGVA